MYVTDPKGYFAKAGPFTVHVNAKLAGFDVNPDQVILQKGGSWDYRAQAFDQFDEVMDNPSPSARHL